MFPGLLVARNDNVLAVQSQMQAGSTWRSYWLQADRDVELHSLVPDKIKAGT